MSPLPTRTYRMPLSMRKPSAGPLLDDDEVIANALNYAAAFGLRPPFTTKSLAVTACLQGLRYAGKKIVPMEREDFK